MARLQLRSAQLLRFAAATHAPRRPQALAHSSKHEDTLTDEERWELLGSQESESAGWSATSAAEHAAELGSARMRVQEAVAEAAESEEDAAERRLAALDAFAAAASRANASAAEAFRQDREAELSEEGARALREAAAEAAALQSAFSEAAGATRCGLLERMRGLQALALRAERALAQLRQSEGALAEGLGSAEAALQAAADAVAAAEAASAAAAAGGSAQEAEAAAAALSEAREAAAGAERAAAAERAAMQANLAARARAREGEAAARAARQSRIERLRRVRAAAKQEEEEAARARLAQIERDLARVAASADQAAVEAASRLRQRRAEERRRAAARAEAAEAAARRRAARAAAEHARSLRRAADNMFLRAAAPRSHVAFVVDRSGSMTWRGMWVHVTRQLEKCLAALHPAGSFRVLAFNEAVSAHSTTLLPSVPTNHARALAWLERLEVRGGRTPKENFGPPLAAALRAPAGGAAAVEQVFLVSDADGTDYEAPMAAARSSGVQINCIYICPEGRPVPEGMLAIAAATGGNAIAVRTGSV